MTDISYQLYCSRNFPPVGDTLAMLSAAGYKSVEGFQGLFNDLDGLKAGLAETGLAMTSCHIGPQLIEEEHDMVMQVVRDLSLPKVFAPFLPADQRPTDSAGWSAFGKKLAEVSKPLRDAGVIVGWHNHDFEFVATPEGDLPIDLIAGASDDLTLELDLGWVMRAGHDPLAWIKKYAGRISAAHVKDIAPAGTNTEEDGWADVGHGTTDWAPIHAALQAAGCDHYVVEHDNPKDDKRFATRSLASIQNF